MLEDDELPTHLLGLYAVHDIKGIMIDATQPGGQLPNHSIERYVWRRDMRFPAAWMRNNQTGRSELYRFNMGTWRLEKVKPRMVD